MNWIKHKYKILKFRFLRMLIVRDLRRRGVPSEVIDNLFLSIIGECPHENVRDELAQYDVII